MRFLYNFFLYSNNFKSGMLQGKEYFCAFSVDMLWRKCDSSFFTNYNKYWWWNTSFFPANFFLRLLIVRTGRKEKIHSKVSNCFCLNVLKLVNLTQQRGVKFKIITSSLCKRQLKQDQEKITKTNKKQIKPKHTKPKLKAKQPVKTMKQNIFFKKKKELLTNENRLALFVKELGLNEIYNKSKNL